MSDKKTPKNPELRFKKADGSDYADYTPQKLSEIADRITRKNKGNVSDIPLTISSVDGLIDQREYFNKTIASANMEGYYLLQRGEFAYNKSYSDGYSFGSIKRLDRYDKGALSTLYICFALHEEIDSDYIVVYFDSQRWNKEVSIRCAEGARNHGLLNISTTDFLDISMNLPADPDEQQRIASLFAQLDALVSATQDEVNGLKELKRTLLKQVFDQTIRFVKEDGTEYAEWAVRRMDQIARINPKTKNVPDEFYYMDLGSVDHGIWSNRVIIQKSDAPSRAQRLAVPNDVFFQSVRPYNMGHFYYMMPLSKPVVASTGFIQMRVLDGYDARFLYQLLYEERFNYYVNQACTGSNYPAINGNSFCEIEVTIPVDSEEQARIALLFEELDEAIATAQEELDGYQKLKKALMQKMFV